MTTLAPDPTDEISAPRTTPRSRNSRRLLLAVIGVLLLAVLVAGGWLLAYQPLRSGQVGGVQAPGVEYHDNVLGSEYRVVAPQPGDTISMWIELRNDGPVGVTIVRVGQPFNADGDLDPFSAESTTAGRLELTDFQTGQQASMPEPFAIASGVSHEARLSFDVLDCATELGAPETLNWSTTVPVTYRVLGMTRTVDLDIGYAISIESLPRCPMP